MLSLRRRLLFYFAMGSDGDNADGTTGREGEETTSQREYNPENQVNGSTVTYEQEQGKPKVSKDEEGNISSYEFTDTEDVTSDGSTNFDTGVVALDGKDFTLTLKCTFAYSDNSNIYYPTLLNALEEVSPYYGFLIRYEGSQLYFVCGSSHYTMSVDSDNKLDITITYTNNRITVTNNNTQVCSFSYTKTVSNLNFVLCSSVDDSGNAQRYAVATITEFKVEKGS